MVWNFELIRSLQMFDFTYGVGASVQRPLVSRKWFRVLVHEVLQDLFSCLVNIMLLHNIGKPWSHDHLLETGRGSWDKWSQELKWEERSRGNRGRKGERRLLGNKEKKRYKRKKVKIKERRLDKRKKEAW